MCRETRQRAHIQKIVSFFGLGGAWAIYSPGMHYVAMAFVGPPASKGLKNGLILTTLERS